MPKIIGFEKSYTGLSEGEAWERVYEFGKNFMPIKEKILQKKYNEIFNKKTKVVREGKVKKIDTDKLVPGDVVIIEKGDFCPVDGKVLEENTFEADERFNIQNVGFQGEKTIYQGTRINRGKAIIEAIKTGDSTYLGGFVKKLDNKEVCESNIEKVLHKYFDIIGGIGLILLLISSIFSFLTNNMDIVERCSIAAYSGLLVFLSTMPVGEGITFYLKLIKEKNILRKSNINIKKYNAILKANEISVVCIDERFLQSNYEKDIQKLYSAGVAVVIISNNSKEEIEEIAKKSGVCENNVKSISGNEIESMSDENFYKVICDTVIFYEINRLQKERIIKGFSKLNIKVLSIIDNIEDVPTLKYTDIAVCTNNKKKSLECEFSDAHIVGANFSSIYNLIKEGYTTKNYLNHYIKYYIMFQIPVVVSLLSAIVLGIDVKNFYIQTLIFIMIIVPLLLLLGHRDYSEEQIFELKNLKKKFLTDCMKHALYGISIGILGVLSYILTSYLNFDELLRVGIVTILFTAINAVIVILEREKTIIKKIKNEPKKISKGIKFKGNFDKIKSKISEKKKANIEDMKDKMM